MQRHPRVPWVVFQPNPGGGFDLLDQRTGETAWAEDELGVAQFAADHAAAPGRQGLGHLVKAVASPVAQVLGLEDCLPCAEREAELNLRFPSLYGR